MQLDVNALGDLIADLIADAMAPIQKENDELRKKVSEIEARDPQAIKPEPVDVGAIEDAVVAKLLASDRLEALADLAATKAVSDHFEANPVQHGRDADPEQIRDAVAKAAKGWRGWSRSGRRDDRPNRLAAGDHHEGRCDQSRARCRPGW
jgi:hypothetical protein